MKKFDKKRSIEAQLSDLLNDLKQIGIKIIENSKYQNGYGEGVCLVLTQLLDKYLINQNFIFKKPILASDGEGSDLQNNFEEVILEDNNQNNLYSQNQIEKITNNNFYSKSNPRSANPANKRFHSGKSNTTQGNYIKLYYRHQFKLSF
jgi:Intra-flagellar transport protein 57